MNSHTWNADWAVLRSLAATAVLSMAVALAPVATAHGEQGVSAHPERGLYAVWYGNSDKVLDLPIVRGGQIFTQWKQLEPTEGQYDFSLLEQRLRGFHERNRVATVQVNGNFKPEWLFRKVPYHPEQLHSQVKDENGSLMYWHPAHLEAYVRFLRAYSNFLRTSPYRHIVLGVRMNLNSLGTEHLIVPKKNRAIGQWIVPPGVTPGSPYSYAQARAYSRRVLDEFVEQFSSDFQVFVRAGLDEKVLEPYQTLFQRGRLSWLQTSSEAEPRNRWSEAKYSLILDYARPGYTYAYAESRADAWGRHGVLTDARHMSPAQWNYWRLLGDLHIGVSFIAVYGDDLGVALDGRYRGEPHSALQPEFAAAFDFAGRYAGLHASARVSPGAWIAFRQAERSRQADWPFDRFGGDYTFLMRRDEGKRDGEGVTDIGPEEQRFGAWAHLLLPGEEVSLLLNDNFARSLARGSASLRLTYLTQQPGTLITTFGGAAGTLALPPSSRWETVEVATRMFAGRRSERRISVKVTMPIYLHMVEVVR